MDGEEAYSDLRQIYEVHMCEGVYADASGERFPSGCSLLALLFAPGHGVELGNICSCVVCIHPQ